jgi:hypothetical protein
MAEEKKPTLAETLANRKAALVEAKEETSVVLVQQQTDRQLAQIPQWALDLRDFDWKKLQPHQTALMLMQRTYTRYGDAGKETYRLSFDQALIFAVRCFELGLSPFSGEVWFNPDTQQTATTVEGRRKLARLQGINLGPPKFTRLERDWPQQIPNLARWPKDIGYECQMKAAGWDEPASYTAWLSEWYVGKGRGTSQWDKRPENTLQTRAMGQCLTFASGIGISEMPDETSFVRGSEEEPSTGNPQKIIEVQAQDFQPLPADLEKGARTSFMPQPAVGQGEQHSKEQHHQEPLSGKGGR